MDESSQYVKMCEKVTEIQRTRGYKRYKYIGWENGDWFAGHVPTKKETFHVDVFYPQTEYEDGSPNKDAIWLPRQDQLQAMIGGYDECIGLLEDFFMFLTGQDEAVKDFTSITRCAFFSMEQLWLAVVMHEKYGKFWTGTEWKEENCQLRVTTV